MRHTIEGFSQEVMVELELGPEHIAVLRWFVDFQKSGKMIMKEFNEIPYYNVRIKAVMEAWPSFIKSYQKARRHIHKLSSCGILHHKVDRHGGGTYAFYAFGENYNRIATRTKDKAESWYIPREKVIGLKNTQTQLKGNQTPILHDIHVPILNDLQKDEKSNEKVIKKESNKKEQTHVKKVAKLDQKAHSEILIGGVSNLIGGVSNLEGGVSKMIKQIDAYININNTKVLSQELTASPLLNNSMIGLNEKSLDLIYDLYDLWEIKKNRLPQHSGENKKITKTLSGIIAIFNALRSGTFASDFELDQKWMTDNKIDTSAIERSYANWPDFYKLIFTSASRYIKSTNKAKRVGILAFLYTQYGVGGTQCPPYSLFLKYTSKKPMRESKVQISKIKGRYSEKLANTIEKFYNSMLGKFEQIFSDRERLRFWRGITKLDGWLAENSSICELRNTDGSFGTHFGNIGLFLSTLFNWLENEGGAWNKLWPDVIIIDSEQWKKFENYCKAKLNVDLDLGSESRRVQLERVYKMERERRESYWEAHREDIIQEEAIRIEEQSEKAQHPLEWKYCLSNSEEEVDAQRFKDDLEWSEAWDARLIAAK